MHVSEDRQALGPRWSLRLGRALRGPGRGDDSEGLLADYLGRVAARAFVWGSDDCATFLADWYMAATGSPDPIANYRGVYTSEEACLRLYGKDALLALVPRVMSRIGLPRALVPELGAIGLVSVHHVLAGAIFAPRGWITRAPKGLNCLSNAAVISAWKVL